MSGFPNRPGREGWGPTMEDERKVADPRQQFGADIANLMFWQAAGMTKTSPLVVFNHLSGGLTNFLVAAWDSAQYGFQDANDLPGPPVAIASNTWVDTVTVLGDNRIEVQFEDTVVDFRGSAISLNFQYATAFAIDSGLNARCSCVVGTGGGGNLNLLTIAADTGAAFDATVPMIVKVW